MICLTLGICVLASCGKPANTKGSTEKTTSTPEVTTTVVTEIIEEPTTPEAIAQALDKELAIIKNSDDGYLSLVGAEGNAVSEENIALYKAMLPKLEYTLGEVTITDETNATVNATLTTVDFVSVMLEYYTVTMEHQSELHWDADMSVFAEMLGAEDAPTVTTETIVNMTKTNGKWIISTDNKDFSAALLGGV